MSGAGNDFVVLDGRGVDVSEFRQVERIREVCMLFRTDGLMILDDDASADFRMEFFNPDGSGGMMCGNGGRCIVAFADWLGLKPTNGNIWHFLAPDGPHSAEILSKTVDRRTAPVGTPFASLTPAPPIWEHPSNPRLPGAPFDGPLPLPVSGGGHVLQGQSSDSSVQTKWTVRLEMKDVDGVQELLGGYFLNTGTRHFVKFVEDVDAIDVAEEGRALRWNEAFAPEGTNVNFVQLCDDHLKIRTFEKGVEGETLACGTGITASAIAAYADAKHSDGQCAIWAPLVGHSRALCPSRRTRVGIRLQARRGDILTVDFIPTGGDSFREIHLTGPAEFI